MGAENVPTISCDYHLALHHDLRRYDLEAISNKARFAEAPFDGGDGDGDERRSNDFA